MAERVLAAMSGGVDSAVATARLVDGGYDVIGVTFHLWDYPDDAPQKSRCCAPEDAHDARLVADFLGIPHYTFDRREMFHREVVDPFVSAYLAGETPSPCVWCNRTVKMQELFPLADRLGAAYVATGHYAKVEQGSLRRADDGRKDQSYFLHTLTPAELQRLLLPLGEDDKPTVVAEAKARGLPGADKGESQELCFVAGTTYGSFVTERAKARIRPGPIVDTEGRQLARHDGIHRFTIGQRRGLGVARSRPTYVTEIRSDGTVVVGDKEEALCRRARLEGEGQWAPDVVFPLRAAVKVRSHHDAAAATIRRVAGGLVVEFDEPVLAVAPGQYAVAYVNERVVGGATIVETLGGASV